MYSNCAGFFCTVAVMINVGGDICSLGASEGEKDEGERSDELAENSDDMASERDGELLEHDVDTFGLGGGVCIHPGGG